MSVHYERRARAGAASAGARTASERGAPLPRPRPRRGAFDGVAVAPRRTGRPVAERAGGADGGRRLRVRDDGGRRWRFVYRQSDGRLTTRRGLREPPRGPRGAQPAIEEVRRGEVRASRDTFGEFWAKLLAEPSGPTSPPARSRTTRRTVASGCCPWFGDLRAHGDRRGPRSRLAGGHGRARDRRRAERRRPSTTRAPASRWRSARRSADGTDPQNPCRYVPELPVERDRDRLPAAARDRALPRRLRRPLPSARRVPDRHRRAHLRGGRASDGRSGPRRRQRPHLAPARPHGIEHDPDKGQAIPLGPDRPAARRDAAKPPRRTRSLAAKPTEVGCSSALGRCAAATRTAPSRCRRTAGPRTTGTSGRSRTPASATCRFTRCDTPPPRSGSPPRTR